MTTEEWVLFFEDLREPSDEDLTQIRAALWGEDAVMMSCMPSFHQWLRKWHARITDWGMRMGYVREVKHPRE